MFHSSVESQTFLMPDKNQFEYWIEVMKTNRCSMHTYKVKVRDIKEDKKKTKRDGNNYWIRWMNRLHSHHNKKMGKINR